MSQLLQILIPGSLEFQRVWVTKLNMSDARWKGVAVAVSGMASNQPP